MYMYNMLIGMMETKKIFTYFAYDMRILQIHPRKEIIALDLLFMQVA